MKTRLRVSLSVIVICLLFQSVEAQINPRLKQTPIKEAQISKDRLQYKPHNPAPAVSDEGREIIKQFSLPAEAVLQTVGLTRIQLNNLDWEIIEERSTRPRDLSRYEGCDGTRFNFPICEPPGLNGIYFIHDAYFSPVGSVEYSYEELPPTLSLDPRPLYRSTFTIRLCLKQPARLHGFTRNYRDRLVRDMELKTATIEISFQMGQYDYETYNQYINHRTRPIKSVDVTKVKVLELTLGGFNRAKQAIKETFIADLRRLSRSAFERSVENCMMHFSRSKMPYELDLSKDHIVIKDNVAYFDRVRH